MMKARRNITLDTNIDEKLREKHINASALINDLLKEYFKEGET